MCSKSLYSGNWFDGDTAGDSESVLCSKGSFDGQHGHASNSMPADDQAQATEAQLLLELSGADSLNNEVRLTSPPFAKKTEEQSEIVRNILIQVVQGTTTSKVLFHYDGFSTEVYLKPGLDVSPLFDELQRLVMIVRTSVK